MNSPDIQLDPSPERLHAAASPTVPASASGSTPASRPAVPSLAQPGSLDLQRFTLMLVDDDPFMLDAVQAYLESYGYARFVKASDPRTAMDLLIQHRPDALLLDLSMPGVTGFDILSQVRAHEELRYTPVIILTGETDSQSRLQALEMGATDFLTKPVDPSELVLRVRNVIAFKAYQDRLADTDPLTGLPNRRSFHAAVTNALKSRPQASAACALLHVDLDRFKQVNDALGHRVGDAVLCAAAQRLERILSTARWSSDPQQERRLPCARIGGNGFVVLAPELHDLTKMEDATGLARHLLNAFTEPLRVDGRELRVSVSVGVAMSAGDGEDAESLLMHAEIAMYLAKRRGRDTYAFHAKEMNARSAGRVTMEMQLRQALERSEFALHFQPKLQIESNRMAGAEVLIGWQHPEKGMLASDVFLPIAEEAGLAAEVDQWLLRAACAQLGIWSQQGLPPLTLTVNLSPTLVKRGLAWDAVRGAVDRSGVLPQRLMLAFSEAVLMEHAGSSMTLLRELNQMGVRLAIDNFGNGGCSVAYLSRSPLVQLKLDPSLIAGLPQDRASGTAVGAVIAMAAKLDLNVVAAGVDNAAQLDFLRGQHCHEYQGRLSGGALLAEPFAQLLRGSVDAGRCNPNSSPAAN